MFYETMLIYINNNKTNYISFQDNQTILLATICISWITPGIIMFTAQLTWIHTEHEVFVLLERIT